MDLSAIISALKDFETFWKNFAGLMKGIPSLFGIFNDWDQDRKAEGGSEIIAETRNVFTKSN